MKDIRIYMVHPWCHDVDSLLKYLNIEEIRSEFNFIWDPIKPDYLIGSEYIYTSKRWNKVFKRVLSNEIITIFHGGEAVSPDFNIFDYAIGFDSQLSFGDRYVPHLSPQKMYSGFLTKDSNEIKDEEEAKLELKKKSSFCNFLYSNSKAHPMRDNLFYALSSYKRVDSLGKWLNNVQQKGTGYIGHRLECVPLKSPYKFSIASENASLPGYASEKILTSLEAHTIPIFWGDPFVSQLVNPKAFINCHDFRSVEEIVDYVKMVDNDDDLWCKMISEPWYTEDQLKYQHERDFNYINFFRILFKNEKDLAYRRPQGTFNDIYKKTYWNKSEPYSDFTQRFHSLLSKLR